MATLFGKAFKAIGKGAKNATKAVGKGVANAAKYTAKNPLKILGVAAAGVGTLMTAGALAPSLAPALAATKVGSTLFGRMVTKTMSTGTVVREKIVNTLKKKDGKNPSRKDVDTVEKGLNEEIKKRKGFKLPVDKKSKSGTEARAKLKNIEDTLVGRIIDSKIRSTMDAEREILTDNPQTNGILQNEDVPQEVYNQMQQAGEIKQNILGQAASFAANLFSGNEIQQEKAADVMDIISGRNEQPYYANDAEQGVEYIEAKQNEASVIPSGLMDFVKKPIVWIFSGIAVVIYLVVTSSKPKKRR